MRVSGLIDTGFTRDEIVRETAKAVMFRQEREGRLSRVEGAWHRPDAREVWLPKSQIQWLRTSPVYAETAHVPAWLAKKL